MGRVFKRTFGAPLLHTPISRLLVEVNRSVGHPRLFSKYTAQLDPVTRQAILARYYYPHRERVESWIAERVATGGRVIHVALHTFTPMLNGEVRNADIGLLYDPRRSAEKTLCGHWRRAIQQVHVDLRVRCNYPYRGSDDGLTTHLRRQFKAGRYLGVELEVNQKWSRSRSRWQTLATNLASAFSAAAEKSGHLAPPR